MWFCRVFLCEVFSGNMEGEDEGGCDSKPCDVDYEGVS